MIPIATPITAPATLVLMLAGLQSPSVLSSREEVDLESERALASRIDEQRAVQRVRDLVALGPRMGGTASGERAAAWLGEAFREAGLEVRVVEDPEVLAHEESSWSVRALRLDRREDVVELTSAWPWGFSPSAAGDLRLGLEPAEGQALLLEQRRRRGRSADGPGLVLVDGETTLDGSYPVVHHLPRSADNPAPWFGLSRSDGALLREWLGQGAQVHVRYELVSRIGSGKPRTVLARLPGRAAFRGADGNGAEAWSSDYFLFCAHGDSDAGGPGADDNASGAAVLLEIASAWAGAVAAGERPAPAREVRFAVWGSEIHSTRAYLEGRVPAEGRILGVINFDQAGFGSGADQLNVEPDDLPANAGLVRSLLAVMTDHAPPAETGSEERPGLFPRRWATNTSLGGTDSYVFSGSEHFQADGIPALTVFSSAWGRPEEHARTAGMPGESWRDRDHVSVDYDLYYHSAGDTPENTTDREPWNMGWCARVGLLGAARYLDSLER